MRLQRTQSEGQTVTAMVTARPVSLLLLAAVGFVSCNPDVKESTSQYSCCKPELKYEPSCENSWNINTRHIAHSKGLDTQCIPPCRKIKGGVMTLDECANVNATVVCHSDGNMVDEKHIHYYSQPCSASPLAPGHQGSVGLLLLLSLVVAGLMSC